MSGRLEIISFRGRDYWWIATEFQTTPGVFDGLVAAWSGVFKAPEIMA
jgi:hypothetical protein